MRFLKWDYDKDVVIEYKRFGECNGCGACCMTFIQYQMAGKMTKYPIAMGTGTSESGVWAELRHKGMHRFMRILKIGARGINTPCSSLAAEGQCSVHTEKSLSLRGKFALCKAWPIIPEHVMEFQKCSYTFSEIGRWKISELS